MKLEMVKDPFEYRRFKVILKYNQDEISNDDAEIFGLKVVSQLIEKTKTKWHIESCVGGKCNIFTKIINKREKRKWLRGQIIEVNGGILE